jgi:uncharacterized membrane protein YraQ (UPF0718 family)
LAAGERRFFDAGLGVLVAVTLVSGAAVVATRGWGLFGELVLHTGGFLALLLPKILAGVFIAAALPLILPRDRVALWIGQDSGLRGLVLATAAGAAVPGGPSMTMMLAAGFLAAGADLGSTLAFVTSFSLLSLNRTLIWEYSFLPAHLVSFRLAASLAFPLLVGLVLRTLARRRVA